jgi:hypothetical protein
MQWDGIALADQACPPVPHSEDIGPVGDSTACHTPDRRIQPRRVSPTSQDPNLHEFLRSFRLNSWAII